MHRNLTVKDLALDLDENVNQPTVRYGIVSPISVADDGPTETSWSKGRLK